MEEQSESGFGLGVTRERYVASVLRGNLYVDHLEGRELLQHASGREPRGQSAEPSRQGDVQAIGQESDKDVRFDACFQLMEDRSDGEVAP